MRAHHNYFTHEHGKPIHLEEGEFTIEDGELTLEFLKYGNYFLVKGSDFNDGIHIYSADDLIDETFTGRIYKMRVPKAFLDLVNDIEQWQTDYGKAAASPFSSETIQRRPCLSSSKELTVWRSAKTPPS